MVLVVLEVLAELETLQEGSLTQSETVLKQLELRKIWPNLYSCNSYGAKSAWRKLAEDPTD